ncbi:MAG TPA: hypothetical protein PKA80_09265 [Ignavibacteriaceae bacterium]|nr:hypothetical protein [Ignavibacteriaceae bacterium]
MKKYFLLIAAILITGCEKEFNGVIDSENLTYDVIGISTFEDKIYTPLDSLIQLNVFLKSSENISTVFADVYSPSSNKLNDGSIILFDDGNAVHGDVSAGDNIYSSKFPLSEFDLNGSYKIYYYITDKLGVTNLVGVHAFNYNNSQENLPPIVSNLIAPDTAIIGTEDTFIKISIEADDPNGRDDIELVFFNSFIPPDGHASSGNPFTMFDDGDADHGDDAANDGVYSVIIVLPAPPIQVPKGQYRWEFQARDRGKKLSDKIIHFIQIL